MTYEDKASYESSPPCSEQEKDIASENEHTKERPDGGGGGGGGH